MSNDWTTRREEWWSLQEAAARTGLNAETFRKWARSDPPRVRHREERLGKRTLLEVHGADAAREANATQRRRQPQRGAGVPVSTTTPRSVEDTDGRVALLEDVLRRQRMIDEYRQEIERLHAEIERQQREIAEALLGPTSVPNH